MMPEYIVNWHHAAICERITQLQHETGKKIMIQLGPQRGKSLLVSRMLPAWWLGKYPGSKSILASYSGDLANGFNRDCQNIMGEPAYREVFPETITGHVEGYSHLKLTQNEFHTSKGGYLYSVGCEGSTTGKSAGSMGSNDINVQKGILTLDDPIKDLAAVLSETKMKKLMDWWRAVANTRVHKTSHTILMSTRWGQNDVAGQLLSAGALKRGWEIISFPEIGSDPFYKNKWDHRKVGEESKELLWESEKGDFDDMMAVKKDVGLYTWNSLYMQQPSVIGGNIIKEEWINYYSKLPFEFTKLRSSEIIQSWDLQFKKTGSSFTVGVTMVRWEGSFYLVDIFRKKADIIETRKAIVNMYNAYRMCSQVLVEKAANGEAILTLLKKSITGMIGIKPNTSKDEKLHAIAHIFESGNFHIPANHPLTETIVRELCDFPAAPNDDICDAISQCLIRFSELRGLAHLEAMTR